MTRPATSPLAARSARHLFGVLMLAIPGLAATAQQVDVDPDSLSSTLHGGETETQSLTVATAVQSRFAGVVSETEWIVSDNILGEPNSSCAVGSSSQNIAMTDFDFDIPIGADIVDITVEVKSIKAFETDDMGADVDLIHGGGSTFDFFITVPGSGENTAACTASEFRALSVSPGPEPWGRAWTADEINASSFGARITARTSGVLADAVRITVTYTAPVLAFAPASHDFGDVELGSTGGPMTVTLQNTGDEDATELSFSGLTDSGFEADTSGCGTTLAIGASCEVGVTFAPTALGAAAATLLVDSAEGAAAELELLGNGVEPPPPVIDVDPDSLSSTLHAGETETQSLTVTNLGGAALDWEVTEAVEVFGRLGATTLGSGEDLLEAAAIDPAGEFAYFGTYTTPGRVVKIDLDTFERVGAITLANGENFLRSAVMDPAGEFAYFGTDTSPGRVVKIDLATFTSVGAIAMGSGESGLVSAVIDPAGAFAYFGTDTGPGRVVKIDLATFARVGAITMGSGESNLFTAAIDPTGAFAYFGTNSFGPGRVVKIDLGTFERVDASTLSGVGGLFSAVIDPTGAFAYFGTVNFPGRVVKIDLETFEPVDALTLESGEDLLFSAVIDPAGAFAYFGTNTSPGRVVKIDLESFARVGASTLDSGENSLWSTVIDPAGAFAYFGTLAAPGRVVKIGLDGPDCALPDWLSVDPTSGSLPGGGGQAVSATFDAATLDPGDYEASLCLASNDPATPRVVVPVALTVTESLEPELAFDPASLDFADIEVGTTSPAMTATLTNSGNADATGLSFSLPANGFDVDTGACGNSLPVGESCEVGVTFAPTALGAAAATLLVDSAEGAAAELELLGNGVEPPPPVIDVDPDSLSSTLHAGETETQSLTIANLGGATLEWEVTEDVDVFERLGAITLEGGEGDLRSAVIDPTGEFAYFGMFTDPGQVVKIDLETFERVDAITLEDGEDNHVSAVIDPTGAFAYFGTLTSPGRVVKIDLETFERVDAITLDSGEDSLWSAVIDPTGAFAYFGTDTSPGRVVKIDLETFERVDAITLESNEDRLISAAIDPTGAFAYFGTFTSPGRVMKIDLETFERVDAITLESGENLLVSAVIDPAGAFAYFGTDSFPGRVVKIDLETFERVDAIPLESDEDRLYSAVIDPTGAFAYFGTLTFPGRVVKIDLGTFERIDAIPLESGEDRPWSAVIDPTGAFAYFGTGTVPGRVVKIGLSGPECTLPDWLSVDPTSGSLPGGDQTVSATFDAADLDPGDYPANLCLASNDPVTPLVIVPVTLAVTTPSTPALTFDPTGLDFGDVELGMSEALTATLTNTGDGAATGLLFGPLGDGFAGDPGDCGTGLAAGQSCTVGVTFAPTVTGPAAVTWTVASDQSVAALLALAGHGVSKTEVFSPMALEVDYETLTSDGNGLFEAGEIVDVAPTWHHDGQFAQALSGDAAGLGGPDGPSYDIVAGEADYGLVLPGEIASCRDTGLCYQMDIGPLGVTRPGRHWDASFEETVSDDTTRIWTLHLGDSFLDVPRASPFYEFVETLLHTQVTAGCSATQYCPTGVNVREQMAVFVLRALEGPGYAPLPCDAESQVFADVPFVSPYCPWVEELFHRGVIVGCGEGNYCPGNPINRGHMAVFLLRTLEGAGYEPPSCTGVFTDVACSSPFAAWIEELYVRGITGGCSAEPLAYCPAAPVSRQQMAVFVSKTFGLVLYGP